MKWPNNPNIKDRKETYHNSSIVKGIMDKIASDKNLNLSKKDDFIKCWNLMKLEILNQNGR